MIRFLLIPFFLLIVMSTVAAEEPEQTQPITRIWLTHGTNGPSKIVVSWMSVEPGDSVYYNTSLSGRGKQSLKNTVLDRRDFERRERVQP